MAQPCTPVHSAEQWYVEVFGNTYIVDQLRVRFDSKDILETSSDDSNDDFDYPLVSSKMFLLLPHVSPLVSALIHLTILKLVVAALLKRLGEAWFRLPLSLGVQANPDNHQTAMVIWTFK